MIDAATGPASMPMYDWPEVRWAIDAFWHVLRDRLRATAIAAPDELTRAADFHAPWRDPDLLFSQTCGYPFTHEFRGKLKLLATPCYAAEGCDGPYYSSAIIMRRGRGTDPLANVETATAVINSADSQSGYWALRAFFAERAGGVPARILQSGSHRQSLRMVASGKADIASIDAVCWAMAHRHEAAAVAELEVVGWSPSAPGLPFVTGIGRTAAEQQQILAALVATCDDPRLREARQALLLSGVAMLGVADYDRILELEQRSKAHDFPSP